MPWLSSFKRDTFSKAVSQVVSDSRAVLPGGLFVALKGRRVDGFVHLPEAEARGAKVLVADRPYTPKRSEVQFFQVEDPALAFAQAASAFYQFPSSVLQVIGVTGTSGKTTTTYLLESIFGAAGYSVGLIGTILARGEGHTWRGSFTTPEANELQKILFTMYRQGCQVVVMEVSSHALEQQRVSQVFFDAMVWTNLSPEHLDYHGNMEAYFQAKARFFREYRWASLEQGKPAHAILNADDPWCQKMGKEFTESQRVFSVFPTQAQSLHFSPEGIEGELLGLQIHSSLIGRFQVANLAAAIQTSRKLGVSDIAIEKGIRQLKGVPGRLERVKNERGVFVWVDYAHKPDALQKVLQVLREFFPQKKVFTVFGCGGDRDRLKRPLMGKIAASLSDHVWVTSDNPRTEDPQQIIADILSGISDQDECQHRVTVEPDRRLAIRKAVQAAQAGDAVLIAGKGHEDYQIFGEERVFFDDRIEALEAGTQQVKGDVT